ncbi:TetR/AcrR family transcriptional regulator [Nocardiopsis metallicus]|uniref:AcrR family transcriptional regulator n=1 Tax=Nocardiopsis metallicus TaxID=179819 RepID=A0A840WF57_9ACTN|nr:TetR/AcrR family transcriptional regulator [Nocardiopsis metallicus]MBB5491651.1 AcrR family transcriptional regulator [Nocardiopsis metallicus]
MPRVGLTPALIAAEAAALSDERGFDELSLAAVAKRFGVAPPSLYKHVDGLAGLRREVSLLTVTELGDRLQSAAVGLSGPEAVRALFTAYRNYAHEHPGGYTATQRAPDPSDTEASRIYARPVQVIAAVLRGFDIPENQMVHTIRALRSAVHGFIDLEAQGGFRMPENIDESYDVLVEGFIRALERWPASATGRGTGHNTRHGTGHAADHTTPEGEN